MNQKDRHINDEAIILRHSEFGEADRLIILFTKSHGKLRAIAKGVRKIHSRKAGHLEPFTRVKLMLARGRNFWIITQAETVNAHLKIKENLLVTGYAAYCLELVDRFMSEEVENPVLYTLLSSTLEHIAETEHASKAVRFFEIHILDSVGYRPELFNCIHCRKTIEAEDQFISIREGGILCPKCGIRAEHTYPISMQTLKYLRHFQRNTLNDTMKTPISESILKEMEKVMQEYHIYLLERKINTLSFIREARMMDESGKETSY